MTKMKELPTPCDLVFLSLNWAIALLKKPDTDCSYEVRVSSYGELEAQQVVHWVEKLYPPVNCEVEEGYDRDEWSVHLIRNGEEIDSIHAEGA